jgi:hypothetical protein
MDEGFIGSWFQHFDRLSGPLHIRFILQPLMATILAVRAGLRDARAHQPAFLWTVLSERAQRRALIRSGWKDVGMVFTVAVLVDGFYQFLVLRWFHPLQALIVGFLLAFVPYAAVRGPVTRAARRWIAGEAGPPSAGGPVKQQSDPPFQGRQ